VDPEVEEVEVRDEEVEAEVAEGGNFYPTRPPLRGEGKSDVENSFVLYSII